MSKALIGIDWGTHSSKWNWMIGEEDEYERGEFNIVRSDVRLNRDNILLSVDPPPVGSIFESGIKGKLIRDPNVPFWVGPRRPIRLTLGELVSFSLWSLLSEAYQNLCMKRPVEPKTIDVRFSLPNWVGIDEAAAARSMYEQAARCACHIFLNDRKAWLRTPSPSREGWQKTVKRALVNLNLSDDLEIDKAGFRSAIERIFEIDGTMTFRFVAESSAAGLTGLREFEDEAAPRFLRKILVVDVGAGSTDVGYVLRTRSADGAEEVLVQLPPANTCKVAGEALSQCIVEIYRSRGDKIGFDDAELRKTTGSGEDWVSHSSVTEWKRGIAEHVEQYVRDIADERWLPYALPLHVLVTGGSAIVSGLREEILSAARNGLIKRNVDRKIIESTVLMTLDTQGPRANDVNRLAVVIGAASQELPRLSYHDNLQPPERETPVRAAPGWTG